MTKPVAASAAAGKASFNKHQFHHSLTILVDHRRTPEHNQYSHAMQRACCMLSTSLSRRESGGVYRGNLDAGSLPTEEYSSQCYKRPTDK